MAMTLTYGSQGSDGERNFYLTGLDSNYSKSRNWYLESPDGDQYGSGMIYANQSQSSSIWYGDWFGYNVDFIAWTYYEDNLGQHWVSSPTIRVWFDPPPNPRPDDWDWEDAYNGRTFQRGDPLRVRASEWNRFCDRINEFRAYLGYGDYNFSYANRGDEMMAGQANQARSAIQGMGYGRNIPMVYPAGYSNATRISADYFNALRSSLNEIE